MSKIKLKKNNKSNWQKLIYDVPITESIRDEQNVFKIRGVAISSSVTRNKVKYIPEELAKSALSLIDRPLLRDHSNSVMDIIGKVTKAEFNKFNSDIQFEAIVMDKDMQQMIDDGRVSSVSVGAIVDDLIYECTDDEKMGILTAKGIEFVELSCVAIPACPSAGFTKAVFESYKLKTQDAEDEEEGEDGDDDWDSDKRGFDANLSEVKKIDVKEEGKVILKEEYKMEDSKELTSKIEALESRIKEMDKAKELEEQKLVDEKTKQEEAKRQKEISDKDIEIEKLRKELKMTEEKAEMDKLKEQIQTLVEENKVLKEAKVKEDEQVKTKGKVAKETIVDEKFANNYVFESSSQHLGSALWQDPMTYENARLIPKKVERPNLG